MLRGTGHNQSETETETETKTQNTFFLFDTIRRQSLLNHLIFEMSPGEYHY